MRTFVIAALLLNALHSFAQTDTVYSFVEQMPEFPGGNKAMMSFIGKNIAYPDYERNHDIEGKVLLRFVVNNDGSVSDIEVTKSVSPGIDSEAIRVVKLLPQFTPGKREGKAVRVYFNLPVRFMLEVPDTVEKKRIDAKTGKDPYYKDAVAITKQGSYLEASHLSMLSITLFPKDYLGYELLGDCEVKLKRYGDACANYSKAKALGSPNIHKNCNPKPDTLNPMDTAEHVYTFVEKNPNFPGGDAELMKDLKKSIKYPALALQQGVEGTVLVRFVVNEDGSISHPQVIRTVDSLLDAEAIRVIEMLPKFTPGYQHGKAVKVYFNVPVSFRIDNKDPLDGASFQTKNPSAEKNEIDSYFRNAFGLFQQGQLSDAATLLRVVVFKYPSEYLSCELLALCEANMGKSKETCASYTKAQERGSPYASTFLKQICK